METILINNKSITLVKIKEQMVLMDKDMCNLHGVDNTREFIHNMLGDSQTMPYIIEMQSEEYTDWLIASLGVPLSVLKLKKRWYAITESGYIEYLKRNYDEELCQKVLQQYFNNHTYKYEKTFKNNIRKEILFGDGIHCCFDGIYNIISQFSVDNYRLDFYIPELKLAIEYDEKYHDAEHQKQKDTQRQQYIENKLGCYFIRISEDESLESGLNKILKYILL